ncbi:T9SS type A sorting domain-containing protein [Flammeovirga agarivorans]|uniref:T9SS type A sorting domain-containing protein n=1 Tax=Flammeovirga agarivorans TaxID=2726742 RepID=A0A7X8XYK1_9BACT|nr:T9SS type A sorting domain-containing protein [Flammeovirga agarivorans]NLR94203.1 T9SS type A sorting domain-containing protein [Flammeovirga agarivorans]
MNYKLKLSLLLSLLLLATFKVTYGQISTKSLFIKGEVLPSGIEQLKLISAGDSNFETILYATKSGEVFFESLEGEQIGKSTSNVLSSNGTSIYLDVKGSQALFHIHVNLMNMSYEVTELKGLSVLTKLDEYNSEWSTPMELLYSYKNKVLTFEVPYSFLLQDRYKIVADADKTLEWYGATVSNLSYTNQLNNNTDNGIITDFSFDFYYDLGISSISINNEKKHLVNSLSTTNNNVIILGTEYDNVGNKYVVGNCLDCDGDSVGYIQKNNGDKFLFSTTFQNKRGAFFQVSEDGEVISVLVNNNTENGITFNNVNYTVTNEDQLVLFVLNNDLTVNYTKKVFNSSNLGLIEKDGYDLSIDLENNIYTQLYLADSEVTVNEINETFGSESIIQLTKWDASGSHQWSKNLTFDQKSDFEASIMTTDRSGNIYVVGDLVTDGFQFDGSLSTYHVSNDLFALKIDTEFQIRNFSLFSQRNPEKLSTIYSIEGGQDQAFVTGVYYEGELINYYGYFESNNYSKGYFITSFHNERFDKFASFYLDDPSLINKENISIKADQFENYYAVVNTSSKTEIFMDQSDRMYINEFSSGVNVFKFYKDYVFKGYGRVRYEGINYTNLDIDLSNGIKINGNITGSGSVVYNEKSVESISSNNKTLQIDFELDPTTSFKDRHPILSSKELTIGGSSVTRSMLSVLNKRDNIFYGINYLKNDAGIYFMTDNGDKLSIDEQSNLIPSSTEYQLNGNGDYSSYYYTVDIYNKKVALHEITSVAYLPKVDDKLGTAVEISRVEHHSDKGIIKYISEEIALEHEFYFMLNGDTTLLIGDERTVDIRFPVRANKGQKAQLVFYIDYQYGYFSYEIITDMTSKINEVRYDSIYDYTAIESDIENNIYRFGSSIENQNTSNLQKLNSVGEVLINKNFSLGTVDEFGNNLKVDETSGNVILVLQNPNNASSFTYDNNEHSLMADSKSVIVYLDNELNLLNYSTSTGSSQDISVTTFDGLGYYAEYEHNDDIIYIHRLDTEKVEEVTFLTVNQIGSYYLITLTADKQGLLYLSGEFISKGISTEEGELEAFKNREVNSPLIAINSSDGSVKWAKSLISGQSGGGTGWPTGFQAGDNSVYITGWIYSNDTLFEGHLIPKDEGVEAGDFSNFVIKIDSEGIPVWSEFLPYDHKYGYNYGYTRLLVDDENLYYLLDIRSDVVTSGQESIYTTSTKEMYNALIKYSKDGNREKVTPLRPVFYSLKDMVKVNDQVIISGGITFENRYLNYQDHKYLHKEEEKLNYTLFIEDEYSFTPEPNDHLNEVTWEIDMQPLIEALLFEPDKDTLSININGVSVSLSRDVYSHKGNGIYTFVYNFEKGDITYELLVNGDKEDVSLNRSHTVSEGENLINVTYQFSNYQEFQDEHLVIENIDEEVIEIRVDETLFSSLTGLDKKFILIQANGESIPDYVIFDEETLTITIDVTKLPSGTRVKAIEELDLILVGSDELQNTVAVAIILSLEDYLDEIDGDITSLDNDLKNQIKVFPTKTEGVIHIQTTLTSYNVSVYDINGKLLFTESSKENMSIKTDGFSSGLLIVKISSNSGSYNYKVIN